MDFTHHHQSCPSYCIIIIYAAAVSARPSSCCWVHSRIPCIFLISVVFEFCSLTVFPGVDVWTVVVDSFMIFVGCLIVVVVVVATRILSHTPLHIPPHPG